MEYKYGQCKCSKCHKEHYCPDGCAIHYVKDRCICSKCFLEMSEENLSEEEMIQRGIKEASSK